MHHVSLTAAASSITPTMAGSKQGAHKHSIEKIGSVTKGKIHKTPIGNTEGKARQNGIGSQHASYTSNKKRLHLQGGSPQQRSVK